MTVTAEPSSSLAPATAGRMARQEKRDARMRQLIVGFGYDPGEDWKPRAECSGVAPDLFFLVDAEISLMSANDVAAENAKRNKAARRYCERCPVVAECLGYALTNELLGTWAGELFTQPDWHAGRRVRKQMTEETA